MYGSNYLDMLRITSAGLLLLLFAPLHAPRAREATAFFEDFSGPSLDRSKWNVIVTGRTVNDEQQRIRELAQWLDKARGSGGS